MPGQNAPYQEPEQFSQLYERTHLVVFRFVYGLHGGPAQAVEDLTAETYLRAWKSRRRFIGDEAAALGWLLQIARNLVIDAHRRRQVRGAGLSLDDVHLTDPQASPEEQATIHEQYRTLLSAMQTLSSAQREIIVLRYLLDWPVKRISAHLGLAENTVSVNLRRILIRMRTHWPGN
jgi:RNA polymerase sigma-70 factor, ECF subfamily